AVDDAPPPQQEQVYTPQQNYVPYTPPMPQYQPREDMQPFRGDTLEEYTNYVLDQAGRRFEHSYSERQANQRVEIREARARVAHNGKDGLPLYDDVVDGHVAPLIRQRPEVFQWLKVQPNPAESAFLLGCLHRYPHLSDVLRSQGPNAFFDHIRRGSG